LATSSKPTKVGGTWFPAAPVEIASKVVLFLHGGAFVRGDGRDDHCGFLTRTIVQKAEIDAVFSLQYRLSGYSGLNPFPAALQDALTGYLFLIHELKVPPHQIILAGDSSGGNLALALLRYLQEHGSKLGIPMPKCLAVFSPWVAPLEYDVTRNPNYNSDYLGTAFLRWSADSYTAGHPNAALNPYITPLGHPFATSVPIFVNSGSAEVFNDANMRWADEMGSIAGNVVHMNGEEAGCHDTLLVGEILGFEKSAENVASAMGAFIRSC
jgi:acetyl esterase/lipase